MQRDHSKAGIPSAMEATLHLFYVIHKGKGKAKATLLQA
jgi:hypothetical protein